MFNLPTEPRGIGQVLDTGFKLYRISIKSLLGLIGLYVLAYFIPFLFMGSVYFAIMNSFGNTQLIQSGYVSLSTYSLSMLFISILFIIISNAMVLRMDDNANNRSRGLGALLKIGLFKVLPVFAGFILLGIIGMIASIPAIIVGVMSHGNIILVIISILLSLIPIVIMVAMSFFQYEILIANSGIIKSLTNSFNMVWKGFKGGHWWRVFLTYIIVVILMMVFSFIGGLSLFLSMGATSIVMVILAFALRIAIDALLYPINLAIVLSLYYDLKLRNSGSDLSARIDN